MASKTTGSCASWPGAVADALDVRLLVDVDAARDRDAAGVVDVVPPGAHADDRLAVRADVVAEGVREPGERAALLAAHEELDGPERSRFERRLPDTPWWTQ